MQIDENQSKETSAEHAPARRAYCKPAFRHESVFETMALSCGKMNSTQAQCRTNLRNS